jgi:hypothetical protein
MNLDKNEIQNKIDILTDIESLPKPKQRSFLSKLIIIVLSFFFTVFILLPGMFYAYNGEVATYKEKLRSTLEQSFSLFDFLISYLLPVGGKNGPSVFVAKDKKDCNCKWLAPTNRSFAYTPTNSKEFGICAVWFRGAAYVGNMEVDSDTCLVSMPRYSQLLGSLQKKNVEEEKFGRLYYTRSDVSVLKSNTCDPGFVNFGQKGSQPELPPKDLGGGFGWCFTGSNPIAGTLGCFKETTDKNGKLINVYDPNTALQDCYGGINKLGCMCDERWTTALQVGVTIRKAWNVPLKFNNFKYLVDESTTTPDLEFCNPLNSVYRYFD